MAPQPLPIDHEALFLLQTNIQVIMKDILLANMINMLNSLHVTTQQTEATKSNSNYALYRRN